MPRCRKDGPGFVHAHGHNEPGGGCERGHRPDRGQDAEGVGDHAGQQGPDGEPAVAPQPVDADRPGPPGGVGDVADRGEQGRVDHGGARAEQHGGERPGGEGGAGGDQADRGGLHQHADGDEPFAADPVRQRAGSELPGSPDGRVQGRQDADLADGQAVAGVQDGEQAPGDAVVEVVDHAGLAGGRQGRFGEAGQPGHLAGGQVPTEVVGGGHVSGGLVSGVAAGFLDGGGGQAQAEGDVSGAEQERGRAQPVGGGQVPGGQRGDGDGAVPGGLVQAHGQAAAGGARQVDLHDHGGGPGQALVDAEQHVGEDDPSPAGPEGQQERDGYPDEPSG